MAGGGSGLESSLGGEGGGSSPLAMLILSSAISIKNGIPGPIRPRMRSSPPENPNP